MNRVEKAIAYVTCVHCKARPKSPCVTNTGHPYAGTWFAHEPRLEPFTEEYRKGFQAGTSYGKSLR